MIGIISLQIVVKICFLCWIRFYGGERHVRIITSHHCTTLIRPQVMKPLGGGLSLSRETQDMKSCEMTIGLMKCHFVFASGLLYFSEFMDIARERPKDNAPSAKWKTIEYISIANGQDMNDVRWKIHSLLEHLQQVVIALC